MHGDGVTTGSPTTSSASAARTRAPMFFDNVRAKDSDVLGAEGDGFKVAMSTLDGGRIGIAAQASASPARPSRRP
jgi:butyryl-CoA dehydrogenase